MSDMPVYNRIAAYCALPFLLVQGCSTHQPASRATPCTEAWYAYIESRMPTGDGMGHGPDIGSPEWKSVVEFRLGIRGAEGVPDRSSPAWCAYIDQRIQ